MPRDASAPIVDVRLMAEGLERLAAAIRGGDELLAAFDVFVRTASDDELVTEFWELSGDQAASDAALA